MASVEGTSNSDILAYIQTQIHSIVTFTSKIVDSVLIENLDLSQVMSGFWSVSHSLALKALTGICVLVAHLTDPGAANDQKGRTDAMDHSDHSEHFSYLRDGHYMNVWAVQIRRGRNVSNYLAQRMAFSNLGQV